MLPVPASQTDLSNLYGVLKVAPLTPDEERTVYLYLNRVPVSEIAVHMELPIAQVKKTLQSETGLAVLDYYNARLQEGTLVSRELLSSMLMAAYYASPDVATQVKAVAELGKLHGLYENTKQKAPRVTNITAGEGSVVQNNDMSGMTDAQLNKLGGVEAPPKPINDIPPAPAPGPDAATTPTPDTDIEEGEFLDD